MISRFDVVKITIQVWPQIARDSCKPLYQRAQGLSQKSWSMGVSYIYIYMYINSGVDTHCEDYPSPWPNRTRFHHCFDWLDRPSVRLERRFGVSQRFHALLLILRVARIVHTVVFDSRRVEWLKLRANCLKCRVPPPKFILEAIDQNWSPEHVCPKMSLIAETWGHSEISICMPCT